MGRATVLSISIAVKLSERDEEGQPATLFLDSTAEEERESNSIVTVSVDSTREQLVTSLSTGDALDAVTWASCAAAGAKACKVLEAFIRMSLQKRLEVFLRPGDNGGQGDQPVKKRKRIAEISPALAAASSSKS